MRLNKIIVTGIAAAAVLAIAGCGSSSTGAASSAGETAPYAATDDSWMEEGPGGAGSTASEAMTAPTADIDGENSDLPKSGAYTEETGKGYSMLITFTDEDSNVYVSVEHMDEDSQAYYAWEIFGENNNNVITYSGASCMKQAFDPESETGISTETVYSDGKGTIEITKDGKFIWKDEKVNDGEELVFAWDQDLNDRVNEMQQQDQTGQN